jgi:hypothetical protein
MHLDQATLSGSGVTLSALIESDWKYICILQDADACRNPYTYQIVTIKSSSTRKRVSTTNKFLMYVS